MQRVKTWKQAACNDCFEHMITLRAMKVMGHTYNFNPHCRRSRA